MRNRQFLLWALLCCLWLPFSASAQEFRQAPAATDSVQVSSEADIDVNELVFGHIGDAYSWPITESIQIPLPCMVKGDDGWHVFMSSRLSGGQSYEGFYLAKEGDLKGKIVMRLADGAEVFFKVEPLYEGGSFRPSSFAITDIIDGEETVTFLLNTAKEM